MCGEIVPNSPGRLGCKFHRCGKLAGHKDYHQCIYDRCHTTWMNKEIL